jgi:PAS domain S-box-containing protein
MAKVHATPSDETSDAVIVTTAEGVVLDWNGGAESLFGYAASEALGHELASLTIPEDRPEEEQQKVGETLAAGRASFESLRRTKDGTLIYVDISTKRVADKHGPDLRVLLTQKDVTALRVERDARLIRARYGDLLETVPDGVVMIGPSGHIVFVYSRAEELFGHEHGELQGALVDRLLPERFLAPHIARRSRYFSQPRRRTMGADLGLHGLRKDG